MDAANTEKATEPTQEPQVNNEEEEEKKEEVPAKKAPEASASDDGTTVAATDSENSLSAQVSANTISYSHSIVTICRPTLQQTHLPPAALMRPSSQTLNQLVILKRQKSMSKFRL